MTIKVFVDGGNGTTGLEIVERLTDHPAVDLARLSEKWRKDENARADALASADVAILYLPDEAAREAVSLARGLPTRFIDASSAHRTDPGWVYGFAELEHGRYAEIAAARFVSNPGCYPTGFLALIRPLVRDGLLPPNTFLAVAGTSGYSGGGKPMITEFESGEAATAFRSYGLTLEHKHLPEMERHSGIAVPPVFMPAVANTFRGMLVEVPLHIADFAPGTTVQHIHAALADAYSGSPLLEVPAMEESATLGTLRLEDTAGTDRLRIHVFANPRQAMSGWQRASTISARARGVPPCRTST